MAAALVHYLKKDQSDTDVTCVWCKVLEDASGIHVAVDAMAVGATKMVVAEVRAFKLQGCTYNNRVDVHTRLPT